MSGCWMCSGKVALLRFVRMLSAHPHESAKIIFCIDKIPILGYYCYMKNARLTQQDTKLLEEAIFRYGDVVSFDQLVTLADMNRGYARKRISQLADQGWLVRLKKGLYALADLSSLGFLRLSPYTVAQL